MKTYRITGWIGLPKELDQLKYRRALIAMSVGGVTRTWLTQESGLRPSELDALLKLLIRACLLVADDAVTPALSRRSASTTAERRPSAPERGSAARSPAATPRASGPAPLFEGLSAVQIERIGTELSALLDRHALSRRVVPHLALFEQVLRRHGAQAVQDLPRELLQRAAQQFRALNGERIDDLLARELAPRLAAIGPQSPRDLAPRIRMAAAVA